MIPLQFSKAVVNNFSIRPIRYNSFTIPLPTNTAHTFTAADRISGEDSAVKAGVSAAPICAYYKRIILLDDFIYKVS